MISTHKMEIQNKPSMDGGVLASSDVISMEKSGRRRRRRVMMMMRSYDLLLRILGLVFTLVAAVVGGVNKETHIIAVNIVQTLPPLHIHVTAKWFYLSTFVYFVVSNAIACSYAAASLVLSMTKTSSTQNGTTLVLLIILDLNMVALLFSANGAAAAIGVIGLNGNSHVNSNKVCNVVNAFCHRSTAAIVMSMLGSFVFLWLVLLSTLNLHKKLR